MTETSTPYTFETGKRVEKFLNQHPELQERWDNEVIPKLTTAPRDRASSKHLKGKLH